MDRRNGQIIRALRQRAGLRQRDLASRAHVSQSLVSLLERGYLESISVRTFRKVAEALGAGVAIRVYSRGGDVDRLLDERHAAVEVRVADRLVGWGWQVRPEVSYSEWGERGSIDLLAWHAPTRSLLVVEVKSRLVSVEATLRKLDEKTRLAAEVARKTFGWEPASVSRVLVLPASGSDRRLVDAHRVLFRSSLPASGNQMRVWARSPSGQAVAGLWFLAPARVRASPAAGAPARVRARKPARARDDDVRARASQDLPARARASQDLPRARAAEDLPARARPPGDVPAG
jgi:transcriptional regulator with XRE-family HTH domain